MCECHVTEPQTEILMSLYYALKACKTASVATHHFWVPLCTTGTHHAHTYLHGRL